MSHVTLHDYDTTKHLAWSCIIGDTLDLRPDDARISATYAVTTAPGGSSATFSGSTFAPDVAGSYVLTVTVGSDALKVPVFAFAAAVATDMVPLANGAVAFSDAEKRRILQAMADNVTPSMLTAWNSAPTVPPPVRLADLGWR